MVRSIWLTWKMHRFEVVAAVVLMGLVGITTLVVASHIRSLGIDASCWPRDEDGNYATATCDATMQALWALLGGEGQVVRLALPFLIPVAGLLVGVPIVAREVELRTTSLAWSLQGRRSLWLLSRTLPLALVFLAGATLAALAGSAFFDTLRSTDTWPYLHEVGSSGVDLVARGVLAFGLALLAGAVVGRTMPALIVAAAMVLAWGFVGTEVVRGQMNERYLVWQPQDQQSWRTNGPNPLVYALSGSFDSRLPGVDGEPAGRFDYAAADDSVRTACGEAPADDTGESPATKAWAACAQPIYEVSYQYVTQWDQVVPGERWGDYVAVDAALNLLIGGVAILLTFPVVARRRPG